MLVLSRKFDESIQIGDDILLTVVRIDHDKVRIGIQAPRDVNIVRTELLKQETTTQENAIAG